MGVQEPNAALAHLEKIIAEARELGEKYDTAKNSLHRKDALGVQGIRTRCAILIEACYNFDLSPPLELCYLAAKCLEVSACPFVRKTRKLPIHPDNYDAWDNAVRHEAKEEPAIGAPLTAPLNGVARAAFPDTHGKRNNGSDHRKTVREWRLLPDYKNEVEIIRLIQNDPDEGS